MRRSLRAHRRLCPCTLGRLDVSVPFSLVLDHATAPEAEYRPDATCNARHAGQLKLLCAEIGFLRQFPGAHTVVYAGAAPGLHIPRLASYFPEIAMFVLVDPLESAVPEGGRFQLMRCLMTDELAAELKSRHGPSILFISDVRVGPDGHNESDRAQQERIQQDMDRQMRWHEILDPVASMLKFRLPWDLAPTTAYLDGVIHLPVFGKRLTHETRLIVRRGAKVVQYDNRKYERQMAYFNRITRMALFNTRCFDCTAFRLLCGEHMIGSIERELADAGKVWFARMGAKAVAGLTPAAHASA